MNIGTVRQEIINKRLKGETYESIACNLGINRALVFHIETHEKYKPSKKIAKILNLDPDPSLVYTRTRRQKLDKIARSRGYACWSAYESAMIKEMEDE